MKGEALIIYITGAHGFIGNHLSHHLKSRHPEALIVGLGHAAGESSTVLTHFEPGEIGTTVLDRAAARCGAPDVVYHLAGGSSVGASMADPGQDFNRSAVSTSEVCEWVRCNAEQAPIVLSSSAAVYGSAPRQVFRESDSTTPFSPYGFNKRICELTLENYSKSFGLRTLSVRLFSIYGEGLRKQLIWDVCNKVLKNQSGRIDLDGTGLEVRDWLYAPDACEILHRASAIASSDAPILNAGRGVPVTVAQFVDLIIRTWGYQPEVAFTSRVRPGDPKSLVACTEAQSALNLPDFTSLELGIRKYVEWYRGIKGIA